VGFAGESIRKRRKEFVSPSESQNIHNVVPKLAIRDILFIVHRTCGQAVFTSSHFPPARPTESLCGTMVPRETGGLSN
jgi:hypothetical protein